MKSYLHMWDRWGGGGLAGVVAKPILALLPLVLLIGCASPGSVSGGANQVEIDRSEYPRVYRASVETLAEWGFETAKKDYRFGRIVSDPLVSPTIFEPWHQTNSSGSTALAGTLHHQRRRVVVRLDRSKASGADQEQVEGEAKPRQRISAPTYLLGVEVIVERWRQPDRQLTGSTDGHRVFDPARPSTPLGVSSGVGVGAWDPVGRDALLEQRLLAAIIYRSVLGE